MKLRHFLLTAPLVALAALPALACDNPDAGRLQQAVPQLEGNWQGQLQYRDFQSDERVSLPHARSFRLGPEGSYLISEMSFTDPGYEVYAAEMMTLDCDVVTLAYAGGGAIDLDYLTLNQFREGPNGWNARFDSYGLDNGAESELRYVWDLEGSTLSMEKQVKAEGDDDYQFRNRVIVTRITPDSAAP